MVPPLPCTNGRCTRNGLRCDGLSVACTQAGCLFTSIVVCLPSTHRASTTSTWSHLGHNRQDTRNELLPVQHLLLMRYIRVIGWLPAPSCPAPLRPCALTLFEFLFDTCTCAVNTGCINGCKISYICGAAIQSDDHI